MAGAEEPGTDEERERLADERQRLADERQRLADDRELMADRRELLADERDRLADDRERLADEQGRGSRRRERSDRENLVSAPRPVRGSDQQLLDSQHGLKRAKLALARSHDLLSREELSALLAGNAARQQDLAIAREMQASRNLGTDPRQ